MIEQVSTIKTHRLWLLQLNGKNENCLRKKKKVFWYNIHAGTLGRLWAREELLMWTYYYYYENIILYILHIQPMNDVDFSCCLQMLFVTTKIINQQPFQKKTYNIINTMQ